MKKSLLRLSTFSVFLIFAFESQAAPDGLTFQGRLVNNGVAVESNPVTLTLKVLSPGSEECLLFEETHTLNMTSSDGIFNVKIGGGVRTVNDEGFSLVQVFSNTGTAINGLSCTTGTAYTPLTSHSRNLMVSFVEGVNTVNFTSPYVIQSVPYALEAERLGGKRSSDYLQTMTALEGTPGTTQSRLTRLLNTDYSVLDSLLNGSSPQYMTSSSTEGAVMPVLLGPPGTLDEGKIWYEGGAIKYYDAVSTTVKTLSTSGASNAVQLGGQTGAVSLGTTDANSLVLNTNNSPRVTVLSTGQVGIGVTNPTNALEVSGTAKIGGNIMVSAQSIASGGNAPYDGSTVSKVFDSSKSLVFLTGSTATSFSCIQAGSTGQLLKIIGTGGIGTGVTINHNVACANGSGILTFSNGIRNSSGASSNFTMELYYDGAHWVESDWNP